MSLYGSWRKPWLLIWMVVAVVWVGRRRETRAASASPAGMARTEGRYDIRQGAAGYAPIVGAFGALAVPAIIVLFTVPPRPGPDRAPLVALAAGFLIVAMIASILGSVGLSAIGAEQDATANLVPAVLLLAIAVVVALVAVLGAFEVLAAIYLPGSAKLFAVITGVAGLVGAFFMAQGIPDAWHTGPADAAEKRTWLATQWIKSRRQAHRQSLMVSAVSAVPALAGIALRIAGVHAEPTATTSTWIVVAAFALAMGAIAMGALRVRHPLDGVQKGLRRREAYGTTIAISLYTLMIVIFLP